MNYTWCSFQKRKKGAALSPRAGVRAGCPRGLGSAATLWSGPECHSTSMQAGRALPSVEGKWLCFEGSLHSQPLFPKPPTGPRPRPRRLRPSEDSEGHPGHVLILVLSGQGFWSSRGLQTNRYILLLPSLLVGSVNCGEDIWVLNSTSCRQRWLEELES